MMGFLGGPMSLQAQALGGMGSALRRRRGRTNYIQDDTPLSAYRPEFQFNMAKNQAPSTQTAAPNLGQVPAGMGKDPMGSALNARRLRVQSKGMF